MEVAMIPPIAPEAIADGGTIGLIRWTCDCSQPRVLLGTLTAGGPLVIKCKDRYWYVDHGQVRAICPRCGQEHALIVPAPASASASAETGPDCPPPAWPAGLKRVPGRTVTYLPHLIKRGRDWVGLTVHGHCLEPVICHGDIVFADPHTP